MGYESALQAAGAEVHAFEQFGSYQGDWWAKVTYRGETGWVNGSFGSCSYCDAFEAEFGYGEKGCEEHRYDPVPDTCQGCLKASEEYESRLAEFGRSYLDGLLTQEQAETSAGEYSWDMESTSMVEFIRRN